MSFPGKAFPRVGLGMSMQARPYLFTPSYDFFLNFSLYFVFVCASFEVGRFRRIHSASEFLLPQNPLPLVLFAPVGLRRGLRSPFNDTILFQF